MTPGFDIRMKLVKTARSLLGVKWVHQGRTVHGIDCGGVIVYTLEQNGLMEPDSPTYGRRPREYEFVHTFIRNGAVRIPTHSAIFGDAVLMRIATFPGHCGIITPSRPDGSGPRMFVHAYAPYRKVVESPYDDYWISKTWGAFRLPGVPEV
jgi:cell wall-associated NlpC family hydrolase